MKSRGSRKVRLACRSLLSLAMVAAIGEAAPLAAAGAEREREAGLERLDLGSGISAFVVWVEARIRDREVVCRDRSCTLYLLVVGEAGPQLEPRLLAVDPRLGRADWEDLPQGALSIASLDRTGSGDATLLAGRRDEVLERSDSGWHVVFSHPGTTLGFLDPDGSAAGDGWERDRGGLQRSRALLPLVDVGFLRLVDLDRSPAAVVREWPIPVSADRRRTGLRLRSPPVSRLRRDPALFVVGPEVHGDLRIRSLVLALDPAAAAASEAADDEGEAAQELWSRLPGPERVLGHRYLEVDGHLVLVVETLRADRFGIFEKRKVRLFVLDADRTRLGGPPLFEAKTSSRMYQPLSFHFQDVDRDGLRDLVLVSPEGLAGKKLVVEAYPGRKPGSGEGPFAFARESRRALLEPGTSRDSKPRDLPDIQWRYGCDLTGDGRPDLLVLRGLQLELYAGPEELDRRALLESEPRWGALLPEAPSASDDEDERNEDRREGWDFGQPWRLRGFVDLDRDGQQEVLVERRDRRSILVVSTGSR